MNHPEEYSKKKYEPDQIYPLYPFRLQRNPFILLVGCGGTGGFAAEAICRLFTGTPFKLVMLDPDIVEPHNLLRQNFYQEDVGRPKAQALAERLSRKFDVRIGYCNRAYGDFTSRGPETIRNANLVVGCVDRASARLQIEQAMKEITSPNWYIDAGNGDNWGQVLIGNCVAAESVYDYLSRDIYSTNPLKECWYKLPSPATQQPSLLSPEPPDQPEVDCAAAIELTGQDPVINRIMADLVTMTVKKLVTGACDYMGVYVNMENATMHPVKATPRNAARAFGLHKVK